MVYLQTEREKRLVMDEEHSRIPQAHLVCTPNQGVRLGKAHRRAPGTPYDTDQGYSERYNRWGKHRQPWKLATAENQEANQNQWTIRYPRTLISRSAPLGKNRERTVDVVQPPHPPKRPRLCHVIPETPVTLTKTEYRSTHWFSLPLLDSSPAKPARSRFCG